MSLLSRIGNAFRALAGTKASPELNAWLRGDDVDSSAGAQLTSPYSQSAWVYIAVSRLAEKIASLPFRISQVDGAEARRIRAAHRSGDPRRRQAARRDLGETIIDSGDVVDLFNRPHPTMDRQLFWEMVVTWNCLRGEFFILPLNGMDAAVDLTERAPRVERMLTLQPELFWHVVEGYTLEAWRYTGNPQLTPLPGEMLLPGEVIHSRSPNPYLYWRGMSPLVVAGMPAAADYAAAQYNKGYWLNNADTGVIVTTDQVLNDEQRKAIEVALRERKRKAGTADRPLFLFGGAKVEKPSLTGMESQFLAGRKFSAQEIAAIYKVPMSVMGFSEDKASALSGGGNAINQEMIGWLTNTIAPLCGRLESAIAPIVQTFGENLVGWFDVESEAVMQEARRVRLDSGIKAFTIGFTRNEVNSAYELGFPEDATGDRRYLPFSVQEIGSAGPLPAEDEPGGETAALADPIARMAKLLGDARRAAPAQKATDTEILWHAHVNSRRKFVNVLKARVSRVLMASRKETLAKLDAMNLSKDATQRSFVDLIFDAQKFGHQLEVALKNPLETILQTAGNELLQEIGQDDPWKLPPEAAQQYIASREQPIMGVGGTVRDQLNTSLQAGNDAGETMDQLADRVREVYNNLNEKEAMRVARTETNMAYNHSRHEAMTDAGIGYKSWLSSHGPKVRPSHAQAERDYIAVPIPVDEPFIVGGERMLFPGDDSLGASAGNIINCQCIQLAAVPVGGDAATATFKIFGLGERTFAVGREEQPHHSCDENT